MDKYIKVSDAIDWFSPYSHMDEEIPFDVLATDLQESVPVADVAPVVHSSWGKTGLTRQKTICAKWRTAI
jgi:hypothetical protein